MIKSYFAMCAVCLVTLKAWAGGDGQISYGFLDIPSSAHALALGGKNISLVEDDASLALTNPALLSSVTDKTLSLGYMNYMSGSTYVNAQYSRILNEKATVGGAVHYMGYGSMKEMDAAGNDLGSFTPSDLAFQGVLAYTLASRLVGGVSAKFIYSSVGKYTSTAAAIDLGINYYDAQNDLSLSLAVNNLGGQLSAYIDEYESIPLDVLIGGTWKPERLPIRFSLTFSDLNHWDYSFIRHASIGADIILGEQFYVAGGYNLRREHDMKVVTKDGLMGSGGAGLSFGAGILLDRFKVNVAYGKQHVSASSLMVSAAFSL